VYDEATESYAGNEAAIHDPTSEPLKAIQSYIPGAVMALGTPIKDVFGGSWIYATKEAEALTTLCHEGYWVEQLVGMRAESSERSINPVLVRSRLRLSDCMKKA